MAAAGMRTDAERNIRYTTGESSISGRVIISRKSSVPAPGRVATNLRHVAGRRAPYSTFYGRGCATEHKPLAEFAVGMPCNSASRRRLDAAPADFSQTTRPLYGNGVWGLGLLLIYLTRPRPPYDRSRRDQTPGVTQQEETKSPGRAPSPTGWRPKRHGPATSGARPHPSTRDGRSPRRLFPTGRRLRARQPRPVDANAPGGTPTPPWRRRGLRLSPFCGRACWQRKTVTR